MKKLLTFLTTIVVLAFITGALYVFEIPPFNPGGPLLPAAPQNTQQSQAPLPEFLNDQKVGRAQTYDEHMNRGKGFEENNYPALAIAEYQAAAQMEPLKTDPLVEMGRINLRISDFLTAKLNFEEALKIDPSNTDIIVYLTRALIGDRKITEAQTAINTASVDNQNSIYYKGILAAYFGDDDKAKNLLKEAVSIGTTDDITHKAENFLSAYDEFAFNQAGQSIYLKTLLSRSFNQVGEYQMAIPLLFEVIKEKKDYRDAWILLGYAYLHIEKFQDAAQSLEEAKKLDPQKPETLFYLGLAYYGLNDLNNAATNLELAKKNGFQPVIQIDQKLAEIYLQQKNYDKASVSYENVLSLNSSDLDYFVTPMWIYLERLNRPDKAYALAEKAFKTHPNEAMSYNLLGWASIGTNKLQNAENYLQKALAMDPHLDAAYLNFGILNEKKGDLNKAVSFYQQAYEMGKGDGISGSAAEHYNQLIGKMNNQDSNVLKANLLVP